MSSDANAAKAGLEGIVAGESTLSDVNGQEGRLIYAGYDIHDLAEHSTFEEVIYLLWNGHLPTRPELDELKQQLSRETGLPAEIQQFTRSIPKDANAMDMLRTVVSALSFYDPDKADMSREANMRRSIRLTAKFPTIVTTFQRVRNGLDPVEPRAGFVARGKFPLHLERRRAGRNRNAHDGRCLCICTRITNSTLRLSPRASRLRRCRICIRR